jgi:predicted amidohydrolase YtcJ
VGQNWRYVLLGASFMATAFLTVWCFQPPVAPAPASHPLDNWDIAQLADHLNRAGVELRTVSVQKNGVIDSSAFLTATAMDWSYLNRLNKDPKRIHEWRGIVFCSREMPNSAAKLARQREEHCLLVGPFIFYGDAELLERIGAALNHPAPAESP